MVSDIFLHGGKEPVYVFSILAPAERDGSFTGVFCAYLNADLLLWTSEKQKYDHADNMLLRRGGELILDGSDYVEAVSYTHLSFKRKSFRRKNFKAKAGTGPGFTAKH